MGDSTIPKSVHTDSYRTLLSLLRSAREKAGLNQRELAKRLSVGQSVVSKCETGERQLNVVELRDWCQQGLGLDWLDFLAEYEEALSQMNPADDSDQPR